jgi:hypothetical protein
VTYDVASAVDDLRQLIARAEALATAAEGLFDDVIHVDDEDERRRLERVAHLISATVSAVQGAMEAGDELAAELTKRRPEA